MKEPILQLWADKKKGIQLVISRVSDILDDLAIAFPWDSSHKELLRKLDKYLGSQWLRIHIPPVKNGDGFASFLGNLIGNNFTQGIPDKSDKKNDSSFINFDTYWLVLEIRDREGNSHPTGIMIDHVWKKVGTLLGTKKWVIQLKDDKLNLAKIAYIDGLTQLPNRRALEEYFSGLTKRRKSTETLQEWKNDYFFFIDIDNFKSFNDALGHEIWDLVLRAVAKSLAGLSIGNKKISASRIGWEELWILVEDITQGEMENLARATIQEVRVLRVVIPNSAIEVIGAKRTKRENRDRHDTMDRKYIQSLRDTEEHLNRVWDFFARNDAWSQKPLPLVTVEWGSSVTQVTVSLGASKIDYASVHEWSPIGNEWSELLSRTMKTADDRLYLAKNGWRDRAHVSDDPNASIR